MSDQAVPAVICMITRHITNLRRCMMDSLLSIPFLDIPCMYLPPIFVHLPTQVYCMQSCIGVNTSRLHCANSNYRRTRSRWCVSIMQKHTSGTITLHISLPAMQKAGRWPKFASYGCHITYNRQKTLMITS